MVALASCKKEAKPGQLESIKFKSTSYTIAENDLSLNLRKELETVPAGVADTAKITWTISDETVAAMNGSFLEPKQSGDITVTATVQGKNATCSVKINKVEIKDIKLEDQTVALYDKTHLIITIDPEGISMGRLKFTSSDNTVATVDKDGIVSGLKEGSTTITAEADGIVATCTLTVKIVKVDKVILSATEITLTEVGETAQLTATLEPSNASFKAVVWKSSNTDAATVSDGLVTRTGYGEAIITATAGSAVAQCVIPRVVRTIKDCQDNEYPIVCFGTQWWMSENLRCTKYDTESERAGATLTPSSSAKLDPYYVDATNTDNWGSTQYSYNLSESQIAKLGYLYNWAAAVGLANEEDVRTQNVPFKKVRQGICPNGWHVPTSDEFRTLKTYIEQKKGKDTAGKHLKTTSGWRDGYNGTDTYAFAALPSGYAGFEAGNVVLNVGRSTVFWTATVFRNELGIHDEYYFISEDILDYNGGSDEYARSVRCVKNN